MLTDEELKELGLVALGDLDRKLLLKFSSALQTIDNIRALRIYYLCSDFASSIDKVFLVMPELLYPAVRGSNGGYYCMFC